MVRNYRLQVFPLGTSIRNKTEPKFLVIVKKNRIIGRNLRRVMEQGALRGSQRDARMITQETARRAGNTPEPRPGANQHRRPQESPSFFSSGVLTWVSRGNGDSVNLSGPVRKPIRLQDPREELQDLSAAKTCPEFLASPYGAIVPPGTNTNRNEA